MLQIWIKRSFMKSQLFHLPQPNYLRSMACKLSWSRAAVMNEVTRKDGFPASDIPCLVYALLPAAFSPGVKHLPGCARDSSSPTERNLSLADPQSHLGAPWVGTAMQEGGAHYLLGGLSQGADWVRACLFPKIKGARREKEPWARWPGWGREESVPPESALPLTNRRGKILDGVWHQPFPFPKSCPEAAIVGSSHCKCDQVNLSN